MSDARTRALERGQSEDDAIALLRHRMRSGEVRPDRVAYAAALGDPIALAVCEPEESPGAWPLCLDRGVRLLGLPMSVRWAGEWAALAVGSQDLETRQLRWAAEAIIATHAWAEQPSQAARDVARQRAREQPPIAAYHVGEVYAALRAVSTLVEAVVLGERRWVTASLVASLRALSRGRLLDGNWSAQLADLARRLTLPC